MEKIKFKIESIDPLGQGVSKREEQVSFIEKVLPGEEGSALAIKSKKKGRLIFSRLESTSALSKVSDKRIEPECPHFQECSGCHFLHTNYENEIEIKDITAKNMFSYVKQMKTKVSVICAAERFQYRNRIQLHYNNETEELGFIDSLRSKIVKVPNCMVIKKSISSKLRELYEDNNWLNLTKFEKSSGHIEIYEHLGEVSVHLNKNYAHGGFSQVNEQMNEKMKIHLHEQVRKYTDENTVLLDLFGGGGNLTTDLEEYETLVVDGFPPTDPNFKTHQTFKEINLYSKGALSKLGSEVQKFKKMNLILDPPRSGMKNIQELIDLVKPEYIFMINCEASSAIRDIKSISSNFEIIDATIFDLFPGTRHFETFTTIRVC
jgi:23S rRNA (uracil1939-C5)-methyltransferase